MNPHTPLKSFDALRKGMKREYAHLLKNGEKGGWQTVGTRFGCSGALAHLIVSRGYEPKRPTIRARLGLPAIGPGRICPVHGKVCYHIHRKPRPEAGSPRPAAERKPAPIGRVFDPARPLIGDWITE